MQTSPSLPFDFASYICSLEQSGKLNDYALRAGTTVQYLTKHLKHRRKIPRKDLMESLAEQSDGAFSYPDLVKWFFQISAA